MSKKAPLILKIWQFLWSWHGLWYHLHHFLPREQNISIVGVFWASLHCCVTQAASLDFLMSKYDDFCSWERQLFIITTLRAKKLAKWTNIPKFFGPLNLSKAVIHKQILRLFISSKSLLDVLLESRFPRVAFGKYQKVR